MSADWIPPAAVGLGASITAWFVSWFVATAKSETRSDDALKRIDEGSAGLRQDIRDLREDLKANVLEFRAVSDATNKLQASQNVVNQVTGRALEGISEKLYRHDAALADHASSLKLITELVTRREVPSAICPLQGVVRSELQQR